MLRRLLVALVLLSCVAVAALGRAQLERGGDDDVEAALLYLPKGPYLRALALGHEETLADLLYIWSIQYYSEYEDETRFEYLRQIYLGAITELDPRFGEAYLVGALIMSFEARDVDLALELYDKALEKMPEYWEAALWAGWECYYAGRYEMARSYWGRAAEMEGAPSQILRLGARMLEEQGSLEAAAAEYARIVENPPDEKTGAIVERWLERVRTEILLRDTRAALESFRMTRGSCPLTLDELVWAGLLPAPPVDRQGRLLRYDFGSCEVAPPGGSVTE